MGTMMRAMLVIMMLGSLAAQAETEPADTGASEIQRVGGDYTVASIDKKGERSFAIEFKSTKPTGKYDVLRLESDHVHVAVKVGETIRLSAEILSESGVAAEVSQVMLILPNATGPVPVWLLSNKAPPGELRGSKYLEMHSPLNDYTIM